MVIDREGPRPGLLHDGRHDREGIVGFGPGDHAPSGVTESGLSGFALLQLGCDEYRTPIGGDDERGEPFECLGVVVGEESEVGPRGNDHGSDTTVTHALTHSLDQVCLHRPTVERATLRACHAPTSTS